MPKIYTRTGDEGKTGTLGGLRMLKSTPLIALLGKIDSLVSYIGVAKEQGDEDYIVNLTLFHVILFSDDLQKRLMDLSTVLSSLFKSGQTQLDIDNKYVKSFNVEEIIATFEKQIDEFMEIHGPLKEFVIPSGPWHYARSLAREVEVLYNTFLDWAIFDRDVAPNSEVMAVLQSYGKVLNRLSDLLFAVAIIVPTREEKTYHPLSSCSSCSLYGNKN